MPQRHDGIGMTIIFKETETTWFILPRNKGLLMRFLTKKGFNPVELDEDGDRVAVSKELIHHRLTDAWHKFTGYDKVLKKLLARYK